MQLWPRDRMAQVALILLMSFCAFKGVLLASTVPPWWGPDEDYHWGYVSYLDEKKSLPNPNDAFYSVEWNEAILAMNFNQFGQAPAKKSALVGDPHRVTHQVEPDGELARQPTGDPTRPVVHAPLYHSLAALAVKPFAKYSVFSRLWLARLINAFFAALIVFAAWVLAAQIFARAGPRLFVAGVVAVQPMIAYATGTMTNDAALIAFFTLSVAALTFMLRNPPSAKQGIHLGLFVALALLSKSSALLLIPIALAVYGYQWIGVRRQPSDKKQIRISLCWAAGIPALVAGWFYVFILIKYHSVTGAVGAINATNLDAAGNAVSVPMTQIPTITGEWLRDTYATYWSHYVFFERAVTSPTYYVPMILGLTGVFGLAVWFWRQLRNRVDRDPRFPQVVLLLGVTIFIVLPWIGADIVRALSANGFAFNGGRFMLPGYPAAVVLFTIGIGELVKDRVRPIVFPAIALVAAWQGLATWKTTTLDRYYGGPGIASLKEELLRASFFRPSIVTEQSLIALLVLIVLLGGAAWAASVVAARRSLGATSNTQH